MDGSASIHDRYRFDMCGQGTFKRVLKGIKLLKRYEIEFNVLVSVNRESCQYGRRIYNFLKSIGVTHMQFTPLIERQPDEKANELGLHYVMPESKQTEVTDFFCYPKRLRSIFK